MRAFVYVHVSYLTTGSHLLDADSRAVSCHSGKEGEAMIVSNTLAH